MIQKLHEGNKRTEFSSYVKKFKQGSLADAFRGYREVLKDDSIEAKQLEIEKHVAGMMTLITMLMKGINLATSRNKCAQK